MIGKLGLWIREVRVPRSSGGSLLGLALWAGLLAWSAGCSRQVLIPDAPLDRSWYHHEMGCKYLERGDLREALAQFDAGVQVDPGDPRNHQERAVVLAMLGDRTESLEAAARARKVSADGCGALNATGRVHLALHETRAAIKWLERAATRCPEDGGAYRWLGAAYAQAGFDQQAGEAYRRSLELDPGQGEVEREWQAFQESRRARSAGGLLATLASCPRPTRAQLAAVLIAELDVDRLLDRHPSVLTPGRLEEGAPAYVREQRRRQAAAAPDVAGHWAREAIITAVEAGVMDLRPDGAFGPQDGVTRGSLARVLSRVLAAAIGHGAATDLLDHVASPFEDVTSYDPDFGPIMLATTRGILAARRPGFFEPRAAVTGAEMALALKALRETWSETEGVER